VKHYDYGEWVETIPLGVAVDRRIVAAHYAGAASDMSPMFGRKLKMLIGIACRQSR
jgi:hypothetical protein